MIKSWIIYGREDARSRAEIASTLGLTRVVNDWDGSKDSFALYDTLYITGTLPAWAAYNRRIMSYPEALQMVKESKA